MPVMLIRLNHQGQGQGHNPQDQGQGHRPIVKQKCKD